METKDGVMFYADICNHLEKKEERRKKKRIIYLLISVSPSLTDLISHTVCPYITRPARFSDS